MGSIINYLSFQTKYSAIVVLFLLVFFPKVIFPHSPEVYRIKKVVIDAGHGGKDSGARGKKAHEKDITLSVALKLGKYIESNFNDVEVIYTRSTDVFVPLNDRSRIANESGADIFISIHCNANTSKVPYGTETYVMGLHKTEDNLDVAMRENAVITYEEDYTTKYEGYDPNSAESFIIFNLMQHSFLEQSLNMASLVQEEFRERAQRKDRGVKQAGFIVLWKASMPSVLVELGFLSNPKEEDYLITSSGQDYLASALFRAFRDYKIRIESRSTFTTENNVTAGPQSSKQPAASSISKQEATSSTKNEKLAFEKEVLFKVQISVSSKQIPTNSTFFKNLDGVEEYFANGVYKYFVGSKKTYNESVNFCQQVRELFPDAFIVAFQNGSQIPLNQAINQAVN
jgi:N-acetylmuramoyl-L-alanine amidase